MRQALFTPSRRINCWPGNLADDTPARRRSSRGPRPRALPLSRRLSGLLEGHGMTAADLGRLLDLDPSMGSKIVNGDRQLTAAHVRKLARHFALPAEFFLES